MPGQIGGTCRAVLAITATVVMLSLTGGESAATPITPYYQVSAATEYAFWTFNGQQWATGFFLNMPQGFPSQAGDYEFHWKWDGDINHTQVDTYHLEVSKAGGGPNSTYRIDPLPGDLHNPAMTLNTLGHVVGGSTSANRLNWEDPQGFNGEHAYYFSPETGTIALNTLNGTLGLPTWVNNHDQIVGVSYTPDGSLHAFITRPGAPGLDLNNLITPGSGYTIIAADTIEDSGRILAMGQDSLGRDHMLWLTPISGLDPTFPGGGETYPDPSPTLPPDSTPVPEPTTLMTLVLGGLGLIARARRRGRG
ncbi:PEP-CTERM sorting domain-containing protein [Paludisphaera rhizosphaerae]|uniref:PEP-CTERM sorting domain-containing protein n=1 Tax=Paludisphaera rhizosphaerae TaxID=2711216 RepID=UPI0013ED93E2|nr:PEP-CTERM sorting domain-containing protein [Paludisphaera rhizosphaerae]